MAAFARLGLRRPATHLCRRCLSTVVAPPPPCLELELTASRRGAGGPQARLAVVRLRPQSRSTSSARDKDDDTIIPMDEVAQMVDKASKQKEGSSEAAVRAEELGLDSSFLEDDGGKSEHFIPMTDIQHIVDMAVARKEVRRSQDPKPLKPLVEEVRAKRQAARAMQAQDNAPSQRDPDVPLDPMEEIRRRFDQAAVHHGELQAQVIAQSKNTSRRAEVFMHSLATVTAESTSLRDEVHALNKRLDSLAEQMLKEQLSNKARIQRLDVKGRGGQSRMSYRPSLEDAERQPTHVCELSHQSLAELAMLDNHSAHRERLVREIMAVDGITWGQAHEVLHEFDKYNEKYYWMESLPYRIGITLAFVGAFAGTLMVFCHPVAQWYGEGVAGEDLPEGVKDISELTVNQVGTWTWTWMEPMIGTVSFVLLCCQFTRAQVKKINMKTYGEGLLQWRADRLSRRYPEYDRSMVQAWAKHMPRVNLTFFPVYEKHEGLRGPSSGL